MVRQAPLRKTKPTPSKPKPKPKSKPVKEKPKMVEKKTKSDDEHPQQLPVQPLAPENPPPGQTKRNPTPIHFQESFDGPWTNIPRGSDPKHRTYYALIFEDGAMLVAGGWQNPEICPACGQKHKG